MVLPADGPAGSTTSTPGTGTVWVITLTVPRSAAGSASQALFESLAGGFSPTA